jgi:SNF2 family DNA or RNA helicase
VTGNILQRRDILDAAFPDPAGGSESSEKTDVLVTSYDLLKRDAAFYEGKEFFWEVLDEAQYIKNPQTAVSKAVRIIRSRHRCALTGTPIENRLSEMWSIFDFLMPGYLYGYSTFRSQIEIPVTREKNEEVTARIRRMVAPFILRRLKKDVLKDLPDKLEEVRYARFEPEQQRIYDGQVVHMRSLLEAGADMNSRRIQILAELTKIRQICCDPGLLAEYDGPSAKREACLELIRSAIDGGHRMLVFSQFTSMLELLEKDLAAEDIAFYRITGSTPKEERLRLVHAFNEGSVPVFLISLKAGGTGLNLTGADMVIHYDPWWNIAAQNQATDRAHRIGQTRKVTVFKLIVRNTIEDKILEMQNSKADLADAILSGEAESLGQMSREQLLELIGG